MSHYIVAVFTKNLDQDIDEMMAPYDESISVAPYAVVTPDGCWHAPGNMGWFGVQNASADDERDWDINYHDTFIKPALENDWYLTILDCYI